MSKYHPLEREIALHLATAIQDQFTRFSLDEGKLIDLLCRVQVHSLNQKFRRRRYEIPDNGFVPTSEEIEERRIDPYTVLSLDLVIYNNETPAKNRVLDTFIKPGEDLIKKFLEKIIERIKRPVSPRVFYRHALKDPFIAQYMKRASLVTAPYSVSGRLIEKRNLYTDGAPIEVTLPILFVPTTAPEEQSYLGDFGKAHQFPSEDFLIEERSKHETARNKSIEFLNEEYRKKEEEKQRLAQQSPVKN